MFQITPDIALRNAELKFSFIRAPGPGGQNVNKVSTAVELRFNVKRTHSLPADVQQRLLTQLAHRLTAEGELIIKATSYRTQLQNKQDALKRLHALIVKALHVPKKRKKTKPSKASQEKRIQHKKQHARKKGLRSRFNNKDY